jgi:hypothetical protein
MTSRGGYWAPILPLRNARIALKEWQTKTEQFFPRGRTRLSLFFPRHSMLDTTKVTHTIPRRAIL